MEMKEKETGEETEEPEKDEDETDVSKSNPDKEKEDDNERTEEATSSDSPLRLSDPPTLRLSYSPTDFDSPLLQETNLTSVQAVVETEQREVIKTTQELDKGLELDGTDRQTDTQTEMATL